jgi:alginate O-acetyltransferase complex protein AlgI
MTILLGSLTFYAWWRVDFTALLIALMFWSHFIALRIGKAQDNNNEKLAKRFVTAGVIVNLCVLGYFKYFNFGIDTFSAIMVQAGQEPLGGFHRVLLPIGVSFFVFHAISYIVDIYRRDAHPVKHFPDFAAFMTLFPQLVAGPVLRFKDLASQFEYREHSLDKFSEGARRFMGGFVKKVLIADTVAPLADAAFALQDPSAADAWIGAIAYTIQLYFDFSGYSDMAVGLGLMMGFRLIENFNHPYISRSITEFWRRWHISLSTWLRDYLYIPLGGNRGGNVMTYRNLVLTMLLGGLWHGANWTFVIWGAWHGTIMAVERAMGIKGSLKSDNLPPILPRIAQTAFVTLLALLGWVMFRAATVTDAMTMYSGMAGLNGLGITEAFNWQIKGVHIVALLIGMVVAYTLPRIQKISHFLPAQIALCGLFLIAVSRLLAMSYSPFLYFQF